MSSTSKRKYCQEPLFRELKKDYCYVCHDRIRNNEGVYIGNDMWRHRKCKPGSSRWQRSEVGRQNRLCSHPGNNDDNPGS